MLFYVIKLRLMTWRFPVVQLNSCLSCPALAATAARFRPRSTRATDNQPVGGAYCSCPLRSPQNTTPWILPRLASWVLHGSPQPAAPLLPTLLVWARASCSRVPLSLGARLLCPLSREGRSVAAAAPSDPKARGARPPEGP